MKTVSIIQEVLLVTTATFVKKQFCEMNSPERQRPVNPAEQLEEACWNGLVNELLPEILQQSPGSERVFLWQVEPGRSYLKMSLGASFPIVEKRRSLDPHNFLSNREMN